MTMTDMELVLLDDLDVSMKCTPYKTECGLPAKWLCIKLCLCTNNDYPLCQPHKDEVVRWYSKWPDSTCIECGTRCRTADEAIRLVKL